VGRTKVKVKLSYNLELKLISYVISYCKLTFVFDAMQQGTQGANGKVKY
jgi:hypothetical protein